MVKHIDDNFSAHRYEKTSLDPNVAVSLEKHFSRHGHANLVKITQHL